MEKRKLTSLVLRDVIFVSDCVLPKLYPIEPLVEAIDGLLGEDGVVFLSYERRYFQHFDPKARFAQLCSAKGIVIETVPIQYHSRAYRADDIEIWIGRRGNGSVAAEEETAEGASMRCGLRVVQWGGKEGTPSGTGAASPTYGGPVVLEGASGRLEFRQSSGIGATAWIGSIVLSRYALELASSGVITPKTRILELGSGIGTLAAVLASAPISARVTATDKAATLELLVENLQNNGIQITDAPVDEDGLEAAVVHVKAVDWNDAPELEELTDSGRSGETWDLVVCADCIYEQRGIRPLLRTLLDVCPQPQSGSSSRGRVIIANYERSAVDAFLQEAREFFEVVGIPCPETLCLIDCQGGSFGSAVRLVELRRKA